MEKRKIETRGATIRAARLRAGLTQMDLAQKSGVGVRTIQAMEKGIGAEAFFIDCVASALGLSRSDLFQPLDHQKTQPPVPLPGIPLTKENQATYGINTKKGELHVTFGGTDENPEAVKQVLYALSVMLDHTLPALIEFRYMRTTASLDIGVKLPVEHLHELVRKLIAGELDRIPLEPPAVASIDRILIPAETLSDDASKIVAGQSLRAQLEILARELHNGETTVTFHADGSAVVERRAGPSVAPGSAEQRSGTIEPSSSDPDIGSEFTGESPVAGSQSEEPTAESTPVDEKPGSEGKHRALIADHNMPAAVNLAAILEAMGWTVQIAFDGPEAVEAVTTFHPQVVFLRIDLQIMDALETMRAIRKLTPNENIKILAMTSHAGGKRPALADGFNEWLTEPVEAETAKRLLERLHD